MLVCKQQTCTCTPNRGHFSFFLLLCGQQNCLSIMTISCNQNLFYYFTVRKTFISFDFAALKHCIVLYSKRKPQKAQVLTLHHECEGTLRDSISLSLNQSRKKNLFCSEVIFTQSTLGWQVCEQCHLREADQVRKARAGRAGEVRLDKQRSGEETFAFSTYPKTAKLILELITSSS